MNGARAKAVAAGSIIAAASIAGAAAAAADEVDDGPVVCELPCGDKGGEIVVVLNEDVYVKWDELAREGVFVKMEDQADVFVKIGEIVPVADLFAKIDIKL